MVKKILHIIVKSQYDGVTSYSIRLIRNLPQYDHKILSCYKGNAIEEIKGMNISYEHLLNANSISIKYLLLKYYKIISYLRKNEFDIIHYHQGGVGLILLSVLLGKKAKVIHHLHSGNLIGNNKRQDISFTHLLFLKFIAKYTHQIAVADHVFNEYKTKIKLIDNHKLIKNSVPSLFQKRESRKNSIGYIGRFTEEKGFQSFLSVSKQLKNTQLNLKVFAMGETESKNKNVNLISPSFNIARFYENIDLLIFTSTAPEGLPLVILEAIAFDVGVIAYPLKGVVEILGEDYPLLVKNENEVIPKVSEYYSIEFDVETLCKIHKERSDKFKFSYMINSIVKIYQSLIV